MVGMAKNKRRGRKPARPDDYVPGKKSGVQICFRTRSEVKRALEAYVEDRNAREELTTPMGDHITKAIVQYLKSLGWPIEGRTPGES